MAGFGSESDDAPPPAAFTVYIGGLTYKTSKQELEDFLTEKGVNYSNVRIITRDGQSKGFGYADFDSAADGEKCMELNGLELDGRTLRINEADAKPPRGGGRDGGRPRNDRNGGGGGSFGGGGFGGNRNRGNQNFDNETPTACLMVKNLSWSVDNDRLWEIFPEANDVRVCRFSDTGKSRGFGFVEFNDVETATQGRETHNNSEIDGRPVTIIFAEARR